MVALPSAACLTPGLFLVLLAPRALCQGDDPPPQPIIDINDLPPPGTVPARGTTLIGWSGESEVAVPFLWAFNAPVANSMNPVLTVDGGPLYHPGAFEPSRTRPENGTLYFVASPTPERTTRHLWRFDGPNPVAVQFGAQPKILTVGEDLLVARTGPAQQTVYFAGSTESDLADLRLWSCDFATGVARPEAAGPINPRRFVTVGNRLYFLAHAQADKPATVFTYVSGGAMKPLGSGVATPSELIAGTQSVFFVEAGEVWTARGDAPATKVTGEFANAGELTLLDRGDPALERICFSAEAGNTRDLWSLDVDGGNPKRLTSGGVDPRALAAVAGPSLKKSRLFFVAAGESGGRVLWTSDGADSTREVLALGARRTGSVGLDELVSVHATRKAIFLAAEVRGPGPTSYELWSMRRHGGIHRLKTFATPLSGFVAVEDWILFEVGGPKHTELWVADEDSVRAVEESRDSSPSEYTEVNDRLVFAAEGCTGGQPVGRELWVTDGTRAGSGLLKDLAPGAASSEPEQFHKLGDSLVIFVAAHGAGREVYKTDGTPAGTTLIDRPVTNPAKDLFASVASLTVMGTKAYFAGAARGAEHGGATLWTATSSAVTQLEYRGRAIWNPTGFTVIRDVLEDRDLLFFTGTPAETSGQRYVMVTDGSVVAQVAPHLRAAAAPGFRLLKRRFVVFSGDDQVRGVEPCMVTLAEVRRLLTP